MIDLHCHILPGLDDGPELLSESLQMARQAIADGIREIVATPHFLEWRPKAISSYLAQAVEARDEFARALKRDGLDLKVRLGFEVALSPELPELAAEFPALTFEGLQKYILLELPSLQVPIYTEEVLFELQAQGICPIIAHPERNQALCEDPEILEGWVERGVLAQATASSFRQRGKVLESWCRRGFIQLVGSDAHSAAHRPPVLSPAFKVLERWVGEDRADWIKRQPARILAGKEVEASFE